MFCCWWCCCGAGGVLYFNILLLLLWCVCVCVWVFIKKIAGGRGRTVGKHFVFYMPVRLDECRSL